MTLPAIHINPDGLHYYKMLFSTEYGFYAIEIL